MQPLDARRNHVSGHVLHHGHCWCWEMTEGDWLMRNFAACIDRSSRQCTAQGYPCMRQVIAGGAGCIRYKCNTFDAEELVGHVYAVCDGAWLGMSAIVVAVQQLSVAFVEDCLQASRRALKQSGFRLLHCISQCTGRGQTGLWLL